MVDTQGATLGRKAEYIDGSVGAAVPTATQINATVPSGGTALIGPGATASSDGRPLRYYWACQLGQFQSLSAGNNHVRYLAPTMAATTVDQVYLWIGSEGGTVTEYMISITISGSLAVSSLNLSALVTQGGNATTQSFVVSGASANTVSYSVTDNASWISVSGSQSSTTGGSNTHNVSFTTAGLSPGYYTGQIYVTPSGLAATTINVSLQVNSPSSASLVLASAILTTPNPIQQSTYCTVAATVANSGGVSFTGDFRADLLASNGSYVATLGELYNVTISGNGQHAISMITGTGISYATGSYQVRLLYCPSGGSYSLVPTGIYTNPISTTIEPVLATRPVSRITSPVDGSIVTSPTLYVAGTSSVGTGTISPNWVNLNGGGYSSVGAGTNWSTTLTLQPGPNTIQARCRANGTNSAVVSINVIYAPAPDLEVSYTSILSNYDSAQFTFPDVDYTGSHEGGDYFQIANRGTGTLRISSVTSSNPDEFWFLNVPSEIPADGGGYLYIAFNPSTTGQRGSWITIYSDDPDESPFYFYVKGNGVNPPPKPDLRDAGGVWHNMNVVSASPGDYFSMQGRIENIGQASASNVRLAFYASLDSNIDSSDIYLGYQTFATGGIESGATAAVTYSVYLPSNIPSGDYYIGWVIDNAILIEEEDETNNQAVIAFPKLTIGGPSPLSLTINSPVQGTNLLPGQQVTLTWNSSGIGQDAALNLGIFDGYNWTTIIASTANDGQETITVPSNAATGLYGAKCFIGLNGYGMVFDYSDLITIGGTPEIVLRNGALASDSEVFDGQSTLIGFGSASTGIPVTRSFRIENTGQLLMNVYSVAVPAGYAALGVPPNVPAGGAAVFQVRMLAATPGTYNGSVVIQSDDTNEQNFDFPVSGTVAGDASTAMAGAVDVAPRNFASNGNASWFSQTTTTHDGADAVQSGTVGDSQSSSLATTVTGPATVSFYWKVSSEANYDYLRLYVDDVDQGGGISGEVDWVQQTLSLATGSHTLRWSYIKDSSVNAGDDAGYVDQLVIQSSLPNLTPYNPAGWSDKIVVSRVTGTNTDSGSLTTADTLFLDWAVVNNGTVAAGVYNIQLYVDEVLRQGWSTTTHSPNTYTPVLDYPLGTLSAGTHTLRIKADSTAAVSESNETDNEYTKTIVVSVPPAPLIVVQQPAGTGLVDGTASISFGSVNVGSSSSALTFTIQNTGTADLTGLLVNKDGSHSGDFGLNTAGMLATLPPGGSTTFTVTFTPTASGARTAALHIASNDTPRSPFDIALTGSGVAVQFANLTPYPRNGGDDKIVVSRTTGTSTSSSGLTTADSLYVDWGLINNGATSTTATFTTELYVDDTLRRIWTTPPPLNVNEAQGVSDFSIGALSAASHRIRVKVDSTGAVPESDDNDNEYTKTIVVAAAYTLITSAVPTVGGTTLGGGTFASGTTCTVTATPNAGYAFVNWTDGGTQVSTAPSYTLTLTGNRTLQANFTAILDTALSLDAPGRSFGTAGTTPWYGQSAVNHDGVDAVRSGFIGDLGVSSLTTTVTGPAMASFFWKVSSEATYDVLKVYIDEVDQGGGISGEVDWVQRTLTIPAGSHTLRWTYAKDYSLFAGSDAGYVDQLVIQDYMPLLADWRQTHFGSSANSGDGADLNDYDKDGIPNLLEYATGKNPKGSDTLPMTVVKAGNVIEFTYTKSKAAPDLTYIVEWSDTLNANDWSTAGVGAPSIVSDNGTTQQIKVSVPAGSGVIRRFVRLKVTALP